MAVGELGWNAAHAMIGCAPLLSYRTDTRKLGWNDAHAIIGCDPYPSQCRNWTGTQHTLPLAAPHLFPCEVTTERLQVTEPERSKRSYWLYNKSHRPTDVSGERRKGLNTCNNNC